MPYWGTTINKARPCGRQATLCGRENVMAEAHSPDTRKAIRKWDNNFQMLKENELLTPNSVANRSILWKEGMVTMFHDKSRELVIDIP